MKLYHGSVQPVPRPIIIKSEYGRDFGFGFYATGILAQAERWAVRRAKIMSRSGGNAQAVVSEYEFDEACYGSLKARHFPHPDMEWLEMVCRCRSDISYSHGYDIVTGKIANDNVGETVSYVVQGIMRKEDALERLRFEKINSQICFCTERSLECISYIGYREIA